MAPVRTAAALHGILAVLAVLHIIAARTSATAHGAQLGDS